MLKRHEDLIEHINTVTEKTHEDAMTGKTRDEINDISKFLLKLFAIQKILEE